jgi:poly(3-hydroxybutyrate) depolymerase
MNGRALRLLLLTALSCTLVTACSSGDSDGDHSAATRALHTTRCITDVSASNRHEFVCDGVQFKVLLTQACIDKACGLIFDVHGWLSNADQQELRSNLARAAMDTGGYIVVQPSELSSPPNWQPDIHYPIVFDFMQQAIDAFEVDKKRVHMHGFSQGGRMSWQFACDHPDIIASVAPLSANDNTCSDKTIAAAKQVPVLFISGTADPLALYFKTSASRRSATEKLVSILYDYGMATVNAEDYSFDTNGDIVVDDAGKLNVTAEGVRFEVVDGSQDGDYFWTRYTNENGAVIEHLRHSNGHVYPDNPDSLIIPEAPSVWFSVGEAILQFFIDNPKK